MKYALTLFALAGLTACATPDPVEQPSYAQLGMVVDRDSKGGLLFSLGLPEPLNGERVRLYTHRMAFRPCAWRTARPMTFKAADVGIVTMIDGGVIKGPAAQSREMAATFDRLIAERGLRVTSEETACAKSLMDQIAFSEDAN
ncbi:hypothetical protein [Caulobacter sp. Root1472]|uniref:hypothetical protein n=2 Tax=Caulobacter TaxID=75 RepID=UPI0006F6B0E5|nr:hypothetical protein [Caulobacter sp. Root1472]KQZ18257.1 hypothetical protein ASD47_09985 [Caulobacter sp. Root1472]